MKIRRTVSLVAAMSALVGCQAGGSRPARMEVQPGSSELTSVRDRRLPTEKKTSVKIHVPQSPTSSVRVVVRVPKEN